ncbi:MAG TPA: hypothetical protein VK127_02430 [Nitrososphaerales archaeon]|nr:hypothetical protein [Nitrososphaerales archaeon]
MSAKVKSVEEYLKELGDAKRDKPSQIKEALQIYIDLWKKTVEKGVVQLTDDIETALTKIDKQGGLYLAADE